MKKEIDDYMNRSYCIEIVSDAEEGGVALGCPELPGCITCAETITEGYTLLKDAKKAWFLSCLENGIEIPMPMQKRNHISGDERL